MSLRRIPFLLWCGLLLCSPWLHAESRPIKKRVQPAYPELARKMHISGSVKMEVNVDADGQVQDVSVVKGHSLLRDAATTAVKKWVFQPAAAKTIELIEVDFQE
jgi:TonB family protein